MIKAIGFLLMFGVLIVSWHFMLLQFELYFFTFTQETLLEYYATEKKKSELDLRMIV